LIPCFGFDFALSVTRVTPCLSRRLKAFEKAHYERRKEAMKGFFERLSFEAEEKASEASTTEQPSPQDE